MVAHLANAAHNDHGKRCAVRVLYLTDSYRPSHTACANRASVLVDALRGSGHDVCVLASSDSLIGAPEDYSAPEYVSFFETVPLKEKTLINRLRNNFSGKSESVKAAVEMGGFDVVVCTTPPLLLADSAVKITNRKRAKLVLDVRDIWPDVAYEMHSFAPRSPYGFFFDHIAKKAYRRADLVVSVSPGKVAKLKTRIPRGKVLLVPNGIDELFLENIEDSLLAERLRLNDGPICVYAGNVGLAQGLGTLLDIAKMRSGVRFLIFGEGADKKKLEARAEAESIDNIEFCGSLNTRGVYTVLRHADISYVPLVSARLRDSIPTKIYEAFACGCPVLLAAEGDAADLLDECGLGVHAAPEDSASLLAAFDRLMEHSFSDRERSLASSWVVANHSRQRFARTLVAEIEALRGRA